MVSSIAPSNSALFMQVKPPFQPTEMPHCMPKGLAHFTQNFKSDRRLTMRQPALQAIRRPLNYAIVDEADSVLIDNAAQPLILSASGESATDLSSWAQANKVCLALPSLPVLLERHAVGEKAILPGVSIEGVASSIMGFCGLLLYGV